jgi:glyoxylase-like metal-dependent hydrolase (beta-lactamase superfamily II)
MTLTFVVLQHGDIAMRIATASLGLALGLIGAAAQAQTLPAATKALAAEQVGSIEFSGTGRWYQFGQAPAPGLPWPPFDVSRYSSSIDYETASARVQITRRQVVEAGRVRPAPVEQNVDQYVSGSTAWNRAPQAGGTTVATAQPAAVEERQAEIWSTPQGFLRAARANGAQARSSSGNTEVSFTAGGKYRYVGTINARSEVERVQTWIANPILGDTLYETKFTDYKPYNGVLFPSHIVRSVGGHPVLDLQVAEVKLNPRVDLPVPAEVNPTPPAVTVTSNPLAPGVYYFTGGTHHSVVIEQRDHVVVVEGPLSEERSLAVIAKVKEVIPGKPIKYLINTHVHFDHSGGLRTFVDAGAIIVTAKANQAYYEKAWAAPRSLAPDRLAQSKKVAKFETFSNQHTLSDGQRKIELHEISGSGHNDAFALVYLPAEKILVEADAYTPTAANVPPPAVANPYSVNLYENIVKRKLDVVQIAALHGPRVASLADLRAFIGQASP